MNGVGTGLASSWSFPPPLFLSVLKFSPIGWSLEDWEVDVRSSGGGAWNIGRRMLGAQKVDFGKSRAGAETAWELDGGRWSSEHQKVDVGSLGAGAKIAWELDVKSLGARRREVEVFHLL
ncbi:unnamed protein product [Calypogeia fissa]